MKILFISHSYPPLTGGVESQNFNLSQGLKKLAETKIIANGRGKIFLPIFLPITFFRAFFMMTNYDVCLLGNGVLAPLGAVLKFFHPKKKFFCVVHGLDITYANRTGLLPTIYRLINIPSLKKLQRLFMVGNATIEEAVKIGIPQDHCLFIPNGVNVEELKENHLREDLSRLVGKITKDKKVLLRLGRFVPHKGTSWFIRNVMPDLPSDMILVATGHRVHKNTAGDPDDFLECEKAIVEKNLEKRVILLPSIPRNDLKVILNTVDLVVSPNIKVPGTMEGFGINVIEAAACQRVVVASNLEGLADAIHEGKNGFKVDPGDAGQWVRKIKSIMDSGDDFRIKFGQEASRYVQDHFSWSKICQCYLEEMSK